MEGYCRVSSEERGCGVCLGPCPGGQGSASVGLAGGQELLRERVQTHRQGRCLECVAGTSRRLSGL